jgi:hypothetical protein
MCNNHVRIRICSVSDDEMNNMYKKVSKSRKIPGAGSVIYFLWTAIVRKKLYGSNVNLKKNCSYATVRNSLFLGLFDYILKNSVKLLDA